MYIYHKVGHSCPIDFFLVKHVLALLKLCTECLCLQMPLLMKFCLLVILMFIRYDIVYENISSFVLVM